MKKRLGGVPAGAKIAANKCVDKNVGMRHNKLCKRKYFGLLLVSTGAKSSVLQSGWKPLTTNLNINAKENRLAMVA